MHIIIVIIIAISLSMDAFSLSLAYGTLNLTKEDMLTLAITVGIYHFFMPLLGMAIGNLLFSFLPIHSNILVFVVLLFIGLEMLQESKEEHVETKKMNFVELLLFGLAVSIDSFSVGIGFKMISHHYIIGSLLFSLSSFIFTYLGLCLGKKIHHRIGSISTFIGGIVLIALGFFYLF